MRNFKGIELLRYLTVSWRQNTKAVSFANIIYAVGVIGKCSYEPIVNLNIKMVDNRLSMVYNTNIRNFYLKMKETSICKKVIVLHG